MKAAHIVGHAAGALAAFALALKSPKRVASIVAVNAWSRMDPHTARCFEARVELLKKSGRRAYVRAQPLFHVEDGWAMVHAGLLPTWTVAQAQALSDEASAALTADSYRDFLANMWGSEPAAWRDDLAGWDRLRVVVNAMTRMRYVTAAGAMEFRAAGAKAPPDKGPAGCLPWFEAPQRASADHAIVCGAATGVGSWRL